MKSFNECKDLYMAYFQAAYDISRDLEEGLTDRETANRINSMLPSLQTALLYIYGEEYSEDTIKAWRREYVKQYKEKHQ